MKTKPNFSQIATTLAALSAASLVTVSVNASETPETDVGATEVSHSVELDDHKRNKEGKDDKDKDAKDDEHNKDKKTDNKQKKRGKKDGSCGAKGGCGAGSCG